MFVNRFKELSLLSLTILSIVYKKEISSYQLVTSIKQITHLEEGIIFPKIQSFVTEGLLDVDYIDKKKFYRITNKGKKRAQMLANAFNNFSIQISHYMKGMI